MICATPPATRAACPPVPSRATPFRAPVATRAPRRQTAAGTAPATAPATARRPAANPSARPRSVAAMATNRVFNFAAGPACLPLEVLQQAQADLISFAGSGMSVMEMSHRSKEFDGIIKAAEADLRTLLAIPDNYKVLFVQGGASTQFAAIPYNFTAAGDVADYIVTGSWSKKAYEEAGKLGVKANLAAKGDNKSIPPRDSWKLTPGAKYVHYCDNETIGVRRAAAGRRAGAGA
jgi:phosphoserine aminotransferase